MKTIVVTNNKGGQGKTFFAIHFAWIATLSGKRVLLVDSDRDQGNALNWVSGKSIKLPEDGKIYNFGKLDAVWTLDGKISTDGYDYVIVDGRPEADTIAGFIKKADLIVCPFDGRMGMEAVKDVTDLISDLGRNVPILVVCNRAANIKSGIVKTLIARAKTNLGFNVWPTLFLEKACVKHAEDRAVPVWDAPWSHPTGGISMDVRELAKHVLGGKPSDKAIINPKTERPAPPLVAAKKKGNEQA